MKKTLFIIISIFIIFFMTIFVFSDKKEFSENENRYLAVMPKLTLENITSGKFVSELESFITDAFPLRDFFVGIKTKTELLFGKKDINDIYLGNDSFMITKYNKIDTEKIVKTLNDFKENNIDKNISLMLVPSSISIYDDKLPKYAITDSETDVIDDIYRKVPMNNIDVYNTLKSLKEDNQVFYKTDHHWTTFGVYRAYIEYCKKNMITPISINKYDIEKITDSFYGTLYSKTNNYDTEPDAIYLYKTDTNYDVFYVNSKKHSDSLYNFDYLEKKDKYSVFLDNNHPLIEIENKDIDSIDELLVIKDSYGNSFVPFVAENYKKVHVVDLRYNLNSMTEYLKSHPNIKNVLILYNINTINDESSIYYLR